MELDSALILNGGVAAAPTLAASVDPRQSEIEALDICWRFAKCRFSISMCDIASALQAKDSGGATGPLF